jgi:hypothetical protein
LRVLGRVDFRGSVDFELLPWFDKATIFLPIQSVSTGHCLGVPPLGLPVSGPHPGARPRKLLSFGFVWLLEFRRIRLCCVVVDELLQGEASIVLESPDQKTRGFLV